MRLTCAGPKASGLGLDEHEQRHEGEVDEEHGLAQTDRQEEDGLQAARGPGRAGDPLDVGRPGQTAPDPGADRAPGESDPTADEGAGRLDSCITYCHGTSLL